MLRMPNEVGFLATSVLFWPFHVSCWGPELPQWPGVTGFTGLWCFSYPAFKLKVETQAKG